MFKCTDCQKIIRKVSDVRYCSRCQNKGTAAAIPASHSNSDWLTPGIIGYMLGGGFSGHAHSDDTPAYIPPADDTPAFTGGGGETSGSGSGGSWESYSSRDTSSDSSGSDSSSSSSDSGSSSSDSGSSSSGSSD